MADVVITTRIDGTAEINRQFDNVERQARTTGDRLKTVFAGIGAAIAGLGIARIATGFVTAASTAQQLEIRFKALTSSAEEAAQAFDSVRQYASTVPFELQEIAAGAANLLIVSDDIAELNKILRITGDIAATTGLGFRETAEQVQRAMSAGIASADRFRERGVNAMLGFTAGVSMSAAETKRLILEAWETGSTTMIGGAEKLADSWVGALSMMSDAWFQFQVSVMESGILEFLTARVNELTFIVNRINELTTTSEAEDLKARIQALQEGLDVIGAQADKLVAKRLELLAQDKDLSEDEKRVLDGLLQQWARRVDQIRALQEEYSKLNSKTSEEAKKAPQMLLAGLTKAEIEKRRDAFEKERLSIDALARAQKDHAEVVKLVQEAAEAGIGTVAQRARMIELSEAKVQAALDATRASVDKYIKAFETAMKLPIGDISIPGLPPPDVGGRLPTTPFEGAQEDFEARLKAASPIFALEEELKELQLLQAQLGKSAAEMAPLYDNLWTRAASGANDLGVAIDRVIIHSLGRMSRALLDTEDRWRQMGIIALDVIQQIVIAMAVPTSGGGSGIGSWIASGITSIFGGLFGGGGGGGTAAVNFSHLGGVVGTTNFPKIAVPARIFAGAPRLHDGLGANEFPAVLERGETVFPRGVSPSSRTVTITNNIDARGAERGVEARIRQAMRETMRETMNAIEQSASVGGRFAKLPRR